MKPGDRVFLHASVALTTVTGSAFAFMKYAMQNDDPFAVANHPLQPWALAAHVVIAPFALFGLGLIFRGHALRRYKRGEREGRFSGIGSMSLIAPMVLSGYLLQVGTSETFRKAMAITHWIASGLFVLSYLAHQFAKRTSNATD